MKRRAKTRIETELPPAAPTHHEKPAKAIIAKTPGQKTYLAAIAHQTLIFGTGPAGTGKTFLATAMAAEALRSKQTQKVILTRPAVEAGESLGFLPGELNEKFDPYFRPVRDVLERQLGKSTVGYDIKHGKIEALPLAYMRGVTFEDCWVILDEAQNTTPAQMKLFLTRVGENCKVIVNGDPTQSDVAGPSGLTDAVQRFAGHPQIAVVRFGLGDVVRSGLVHDLLRQYELQPVARTSGC